MTSLLHGFSNAKINADIINNNEIIDVKSIFANNNQILIISFTKILLKHDFKHI